MEAGPGCRRWGGGEFIPPTAQSYRLWLECTLKFTFSAHRWCQAGSVCVLTHFLQRPKQISEVQLFLAQWKQPLDGSDLSAL